MCDEWMNRGRWVRFRPKKRHTQAGVALHLRAASESDRVCAAGRGEDKVATEAGSTKTKYKEAKKG